MVTDWLVPSDREQLQRFLGFADSYRHFIRNASSAAVPLHTLTSLGTWVIFLKLPDQNLQLNRVTLLIWEWERRTTKFSLCVFFLRNFTQPYVDNWELLVVTLALEEWRYRLEGAVLVWPQKLEYMRTHKRLKSQQARCFFFFFTRFNFTLHQFEL